VGTNDGGAGQDISHKERSVFVIVYYILLMLLQWSTIYSVF
jgi:hypothetical protein